MRPPDLFPVPWRYRLYMALLCMSMANMAKTVQPHRIETNGIERQNAGCYPERMLSRLETRRAWTGLATVLLAVSALIADGGGPSPASERSGYLDLSGSKLYYEECGSGPAIVLLHDGLLHSVSWDEVWQPLAKKYRVIRYD